MNIIQMVKAYGGMIVGKTDYWHPDINANHFLKKDRVAKYPIDMAAKAE
jgi:heparosan-N-sulfate-glucuronate 5-epimerase